MNLIKRIKNLYKLSELEPKLPTAAPSPDRAVTLVKPVEIKQEGRFIALNPRNPAKEITEEQP